MEEWLAGFCCVEMDDVLVFRSQYSIPKSKIIALPLFLQQQWVLLTETSSVSSQEQLSSLLAAPTLSYRNATHNQLIMHQLV